MPLSASQTGLEALRRMGPEKAATALVHALKRNDSQLYEQYRSFYPRLPAWFRNRFPLRLTRQQRATIILGAIEFLDLNYQREMIPFVMAYLEQPDLAARLAACELLARMPQTAFPALPVLERLTTCDDVSISQAAQAATVGIKSAGGQ